MYKCTEKNQPLVTVMIATFNSGNILDRTLQALSKQSYGNIETILIDGGSTDNTFDIATKYNCKIIDNPATDPVSAKIIGINNANGKYLVTLDHDEVIENIDSILIKVNALEKNPECKVALCSGYKRPSGYPLINQYLSEYGDPFSLFVYRFSKDYQYFERILNSGFDKVHEEEKYSVYSFAHMKKNPIIELVCLGTMINLDYFLKKFDVKNDPSVLVNLFYYMIDNGDTNVVYVKNDPLVHYSIDSVKAYFPKLKWRICNNVHFADKAKNGFTGRAKLQNSKSITLKKYIFIIYSIMIFPALIDGLGMGVHRKNIAYMWHPIFCLYVTYEIAWQLFLKMLGYTPDLMSYDGKKKIR